MRELRDLVVRSADPADRARFGVGDHGHPRFVSRQGTRMKCAHRGEVIGLWKLVDFQNADVQNSRLVTSARCEMRPVDSATNIAQTARFARQLEAHSAAMTVARTSRRRLGWPRAERDARRPAAREPSAPDQPERSVCSCRPLPSRARRLSHLRPTSYWTLRCALSRTLPGPKSSVRRTKRAMSAAKPVGPPGGVSGSAAAHQRCRSDRS
jgi:hypothetical protein